MNATSLPLKNPQVDSVESLKLVSNSPLVLKPEDFTSSIVKTLFDSLMLPPREQLIKINKNKTVRKSKDFIIEIIYNT